MVHHLINNGAAVNQSDPQGYTPLHRAAALAHLGGYLEIYELLLVRGGRGGGGRGGGGDNR
jgi:[acyl-carrier-protein] S-malonyltransferase